MKSERDEERKKNDHYYIQDIVCHLNGVTQSVS